MTSAPPPYDDGGDPPETGLRDDRDDEHEHDDDYGWEPNYLVRRAVAIGVIIVVLAAASVIAGRIIGARGDDEASSPVNHEWNTVVLIADDEVRLVDPKTGEVTETYPGDEPLLDSVSVVTGDKLVLLNDFGRITELDLAEGTIRRSSTEEGGTMSPSPNHPAIVLAGVPAGGDVTVVDTDARTTFDIGDASGLTDPLMFVDEVLVNRSGSHVATADARSFQSVLVGVADEAPVLLAGQVVALDDDTVITAQRAGASAELEFYDLTGERLGSVDAPSPQVTMLIGDSRALIVAADGSVAGISPGGAVNDLGTLASSSDGDTATLQVLGGVAVSDEERLLVLTDGEVILLGTDGVEIARFTGDLLSPAAGPSRCALVGSARSHGTAVHVDLETGEVLGETAGGLVASASADGCTVSMIGDPRLVVRGAEVEIDTTNGSITVAPDGSAYVLSTSIRDRLFSLTTEANEPVDLADDTVLVRFAEI